jgi:hypothetical protein
MITERRDCVDGWHEVDVEFKLGDSGGVKVMMGDKDNGGMTFDVINEL